MKTLGLSWRVQKIMEKQGLSDFTTLFTLHLMSNGSKLNRKQKVQKGKMETNILMHSWISMQKILSNVPPNN